MEHDVQGDARGVFRNASTTGEAQMPPGSALRASGSGPNGKQAPIAHHEDEAAALLGFDDAVDRLGHVARDASALVAENAEHLASIKVGNDRIERLIAANQVALDRLVGLPAI